MFSSSRNRKKPAGLLLAGGAIAASVALSGCSAPSGAASGAASTSTADAASVDALQLGNPTLSLCAGKTYTIGTTIHSSTEPFAAAVTKGGEDIAKSLGCVTFISLDDNNDPSTVASNVQSLIARHVDGVVLNDGIASANSGLIRQLNNAKIPVVTGTVQSDNAPFIGPDSTASGEQLGEASGALFAQKFEGHQPYVIEGRLDSAGPTFVDEFTGFESGLAKQFPNIPSDHIIKIDTAANPSTAASAAVSALSAIPSDAPIIISSVGDSFSQPMLKAVQGQGRQAIGAGFGGDSSSRSAVCAGDYVISGWQPELYYNYFYPAIIGLINGSTSVPDRIVVPTKLLSKDTLGQVYPGEAC